ncbi:helix-turn-helix transcriptional regulator [Streptomyces samsunensis]|uniref:PadR family transcriptional regulator n=1 Tax=Streptomyces autolyticus TaxID=75293 RepID=A0ABM6H8S5_9ACTN|nr:MULTISPECIES: PadR family transcriptional regulator [Streptomyces]MCC4318747.1 PadR family transcriptional regulator [Streptomyces malaysiensis]AQA10284.1 PadR family transcriptional regulator [Streptomyces autolyticus]MCQ6253137.1 PadR family transcriptional regulator [Streptomyces malaysiensis]NUH40522.1 helix-turn-helix transcriptional regulator [Streptomyces samsunensis]WHX22724.1 PadR family transcriptional regulator [Streptomyces sp. NA07423]
MRSHGHGREHCGPGHRGRGEGEGRRAAFGPFGPGFDGPPFGGPPFGGRGRGGPGGRMRGRARRGDVRASILALLKDRPMHGYEMIQEITERSGGAWRPSPGSVYPTLQLLEDEGLIGSESEGGKKLFALTDAGRAEAEAGPAAPWEEAGRGIDWEAMQEVRQAGFGLMEAFAQVWRTGSADQRRKAVSVINESRKRLYLILAEQEDGTQEESEREEGKGDAERGGES